MSAKHSKLPKQWRHWCADSRLRPTGYDKRSHWSRFSLVGRGFHWRVNDKNMLQRGDNYANFDRWALCTVFEAPVPQSLAEFRKFVQQALKAAKATKDTR